MQRAGVVLFDASWHQGVVGLVASRIKDRLRRPVIAFALADAATLRGSARSIPGVHIRDVLDAMAARHPQLISRFGGHAMAAGLTLERAQLDHFARAFDAEVARWMAGAPAADEVRDRRRARRAGDRAGDRAGAARRGSLGPGLSRAELRRRVQHPQRARDRRATPEDVGRGARERALVRCDRLQPRGAGRRSSCRRPVWRTWCTAWTSTNTRASGACSCSSITSCRRLPKSAAAVIASCAAFTATPRPQDRHGSQSAQAPAQRSRERIELVTGVSLSTTSRRSASRK